MTGTDHDRWPASGIAASTLLAGLLAASAPAGAAGSLPAGSDFGADASEIPRQILASERRGGTQSYLAALGNMLFSSPEIFGEPARSAGLACGTCHIEGDINPRLFIPGLSARPGGLDVTSALFFPPADDGVFNPVDTPSLRGIRLTAPYGRDGRVASLREFTRNVIVLEFGGAEPSPLVLDALAAYMQEFEFLPNPKIDALGRLTGEASEAARRGEEIFRRPFAGMGGASCADCHMPAALFRDGQRHDVGTGGVYDTPTLLNVRFTAPYFADGRAADLGQVIDHFDTRYGLGFGDAERADLLAYLETVGDGEEPFEPASDAGEVEELAVFAGTLPLTLQRRDRATAELTVATLDRALADLAASWTGTANGPAYEAVEAARARLAALREFVGSARWTEAGEAAEAVGDALAAAHEALAAGG